MKKFFQGSGVALVTPLKNNTIDEQTLRTLVDWHIAAGTDFLVPCGTTGEAPTLSYEEHEQIVRIVVEQAAGRVPVLAGAGSNSTDNAIKLTKQAKKAGATGTLQVTPYYNKPTQEGLFKHFEAIATAVDLPIVLYNVPGRTSVNMEPDTVARLAAIDNIVGVKEASGKLEQIEKIIEETPDSFNVYSGDDPLNAQIYALGGDGTISVTANIIPNRVAKVWDLFQKDNKKEGFAEQERQEKLNRILFIETNPIPVKTALHLMKKCPLSFRLPLCEMKSVNREQLIAVLKEENLIS